MCSFFSLRGILLTVFFKACTGAGPVDTLKVQTSNSNTKVSRVQVHLLSDGPTRGNLYWKRRACLGSHENQCHSKTGNVIVLLKRAIVLLFWGIKSASTDKLSEHQGPWLALHYGLYLDSAYFCIWVWTLHFESIHRSSVCTDFKENWK